MASSQSFPPPPPSAARAESGHALLRQVVDHVAEGLCVFDADLRLVAWNARMVELMGLGGMPLSVGCPMRELLLEMARRGEFGAVDPEAEVARRLALAADARPGVEERLRPGGGVVEVRRTPMAGGGLTLMALDITARRAAEQALQHDRNLLTLLLERTEQGVWTIDNDLRTTDANPAMCRMLGLAREQLLGRSIYDFVDEDNAAIFRREVRRRAEGESGSYEITLLRPDGGRVHCQNNPMPLFDARGVKVGAIGLFSDITALKHASLELQRTGEQLAAKTRVLESTFDTLTQGVLSVAPDGRVEAWNRRAAELMEVPAEMLARRPLLKDVIAWQIGQGVFVRDAGALKAQWLQAAERQARGDDDDVARPMHYQRQRRDGRVLDVQVHVSADGAHVRTYTDVTEAVLAQRALSQSEARFRAMADAAPAFICQVDLQGRALWFNQRWLRCIGRTLAQALAEDWDARIHPDDRPRAQQVFEQALARQAPFEVEFRVITPDGDEPWVADHGIPHLDADGRFDGYLVYGWEITARKAAERSLIAARDEAERANRAKSEFLSRMSHELRTPLNAVLGFAQLIERSDAARSDGPLRDQVQHILRGGRHLLVLINEVLDLARIESGTLPVRLEAVALAPLVDDCRRLLEPMARERGVRMQVHAPAPADVAVRADATRLQQVLINLLSNAIKYNQAGGEVRVSCRSGAGTVRIEVSDTGPGLTPAQCERLFQAFERLDADARAVEGAGIGLALSKVLVVLMGGGIGVRSQPGAGSTFWVELGRALPAAVEPADAAAGPDHTLPRRADGRPWRVLYVEDNPVNQLLMEGMLGTLDGVQLRMADHPEAGLAMAREWAPDLLLLDIQLPGMSGFELLRRLRAEAPTAAIPAVAVTANAMADDVRRARAAGFDQHLSKPLVLADLVAVVRSLLPQGGG